MNENRFKQHIFKTSIFFKFNESFECTPLGVLFENLYFLFNDTKELYQIHFDSDFVEYSEKNKQTNNINNRLTFFSTNFRY